MGYYLNIHFPPNTANGGILMELACEKARFWKSEFVYNATESPEAPDTEWYVPGGTLRVYGTESEDVPGAWAHIRLSWGTDMKTFAKLLTLLLRIGEQYGFRIRDGQIKKYISPETMAEAVRALRTGLAMIDSMWGRVRGKKTQPNFPGDPDFMDPPDFTDPILAFFPVLGKATHPNADILLARLNDAIAFHLIDFVAINDIDLAPHITGLLSKSGVTTVEKLLMSTPDQLRARLSGEPAIEEHIAQISKRVRDLLGLWEVDDFSDASLRIEPDG
jgi:hypothetical protein